MIYEVKNSFSKSKFSLKKINGKIYVKKTPLKFNKRELLSIKKQNNFKSYIIHGYKVESAKIVNFNKKKNNFYLVEFFEGKTGDQILLTGNKDEIKILKIFLNHYFSKKHLSNVDSRNTKLIREKFNKIKKNKKFKKIEGYKEINSFFNKLIKKKIYKFKNFYCHGDLTLSNIIISKKNKKIILFDFLHTYEDNLLQDFSKVFQEFNLHWTSRKLDTLDKVRSDIIYKSIIDKDFWNKIDPKLTNSLKLEFLMTILRIVPYILENDKITFNWISKSVYTIKKFNLNL